MNTIQIEEGDTLSISMFVNGNYVGEKELACSEEWQKTTFSFSRDLK